MEIKTRFAIGDKVWIIQNSKATQITIEIIRLDNKAIMYGANAYDLYLESECFATKEALLEYVAGE